MMRNPIRIKTLVDKYKVYTMFLPETLKWYSLVSLGEKNVATYEALTDAVAFDNHARACELFSFQLLGEPIEEIEIEFEEETNEQIESI